MEQLEILARRFRDAIEQAPADQLPVTMQNFPTGACGDATLLLGHYLKAQGLDAFDYVLGERDDHSHAWVQQGDIIIDITADQFAEIDRPIIVTANPDWHNEFKAEVLHEADFTIYDAYTAATLAAAYHTILQHMEVPA
ncbi:hypothetical protein EFR00_00415 [Rhizobium sophoriradicis]|uniref:hypothetical protein n=1 Tax=Rhizobium sophoriradicis TaxID=1535245 RepID=UPI00098ECD7F|nr:hypothetical protein [Rhizobium sophoriradicis]RSC20992.1 hypothetical protein EFR00_00415 [Rhizobium sophoriradicis]